MIKLDEKFQTIQRSVSSFNGSISDVSVVTDTLFVSSVTIDFETGVLTSLIRKGTASPSFSDNLDAVTIRVTAGGTFVSSDGTWAGSMPQIAALVEQLRQAFDQFILGSGLVTGTAE